MMKLTIIGLAGTLVAAGTLFPTAAEANTVSLYSSAFSYSVGGEFTAVTTPSLFNGNYAASTLVSTSTGVGFETFCVQTAVEFTPANASGDS